MNKSLRNHRLISRFTWLVFVVFASGLLAGCASNQVAKNTTDTTNQTPVKSERDPWYGFNHAMFTFNDTTDKYFLKPVAQSYVFIAPEPVRHGVSNVFSNILEVPSALNGVLQGNMKSAGRDSGRFIVNSTLGLLGIFDVASHMGLKDEGREDFGQTLAVWGVKSGPYVVLPFLGPSTLRDSFSLPVDWVTDPKSAIDHVPTRNTVRALSIIDMRANLLPIEKTISGDKYIFIREAYLQNREFQVKNGKVEDSFGEDDDSQPSQ